MAVARKLAVILHTLWRRDEDYDPLCGLPQAVRSQASPAENDETNPTSPNPGGSNAF